MKVTLPERARARIEMLPLIDIVFLLLVFFIYAMLSMAVHKGMPVDLPSSATAEVDQETTLSVTVQAGATGHHLIFVNKEAVDLEQLSPTLRAEAALLRRQLGKEPGVLLYADRTIDYQELFHVLDRVNEAGLYHVSLQADVDLDK